MTAARGCIGGQDQRLHPRIRDPVQPPGVGAAAPGSVVLNLREPPPTGHPAREHGKVWAWLGTEINVSATHNSPLWNLH